MTIENLVEEFESNNELIREPLVNFWQIARETFPKSPKKFLKRVYEETPFRDWQDDFDVVNSRYPKTLNKKIHGNIDYYAIYPYITNLMMLREEVEKLFDLTLRNSQILKEILAIDLQMRFPNGYVGEYPFCGLDIDTISGLGGTWSLIEPCYQENDFEERLFQNHTDKQKFEMNKIKVLRKYRPCDDCDILLIKCPTPGREVENVLNDYIGRVRRLIISSEAELPLSRINSIAGLSLEGLRSENVVLLGGSISYPLTSLYLYEPM